MAYKRLEDTFHEMSESPMVAGDPAGALSIFQERLGPCRGQAWQETLVLKEVWIEDITLTLTFRLVNRLGRFRDKPLEESEVSDMVLSMARSPLMQNLLNTGASISIAIDHPSVGSRNSFKNVMGQLMRLKRPGPLEEQ